MAAAALAIAGTAVVVERQGSHPRGHHASQSARAAPAAAPAFERVAVPSFVGAPTAGDIAALAGPGDGYGRWTAAGSPDECVKHLLAYKELGFSEVTLRITGWDQFGQLERVMREVLPRVLN